jgi:hypothetical protein
MPKALRLHIPITEKYPHVIMVGGNPSQWAGCSPELTGRIYRLTAEQYDSLCKGYCEVSDVQKELKNEQIVQVVPSTLFNFSLRDTDFQGLVGQTKTNETNKQ